MKAVGSFATDIKLMPGFEYSRLPEGAEGKGAEGTPSTFSDVIAAKRAESIFSCIRNEARISEEIQILSIVIDGVQTSSKRFRDVSGTVAELWTLELLADEMEALSTLNLSFPMGELFARAIESVPELQPIPSVSDVQGFLVEMEQLNEQEKWRLADENNDEVDITELAFYPYGGTTFAEKYGEIPILAWFSMAHCSQFFGGKKLTESWTVGSAENAVYREYMPWLSVSGFAHGLVNAQIVTPDLFDSRSTQVLTATGKLAGKTLPLMLLRLTQLKAVMIEQVERSRGAKNKVSGLLLSAAIAAGQTFAAYVNTKYFQADD